MSSQISILEQEIDELAISVKAYMALHEHELKVVGDLLTLHEEDLHQIMRGDMELVGEVAAALWEHNLRLREDHGICIMPFFETPEESWACLHIWAEGDDAFEEIIHSIAAAYMARDLRLQDWDTDDELEQFLLAHLGQTSAMNRSVSLGADEILVVPLEADGWYAVMSAAWELCPPTRHPLAAALSYDFPVVSMSSVSGYYSEITRYEDGAALQTRIYGTEIPQNLEPLSELVALDLAWFEPRGSVEGPKGLFPLLLDLENFGSVTGCEGLGYRRSLESGFEDFAEDGGEILIFR